MAICAIHGGGVISYVRADGSVLHTLGDEGGFERKLQALGLATELPARQPS